MAKLSAKQTKHRKKNEEEKIPKAIIYSLWIALILLALWVIFLQRGGPVTPRFPAGGVR